ncbi:MAG TPA: molybdopterin-dependent oxidoreductase [Desulfomonilaceae bacterium]|nr:molybdopterin-dependent oxidoreductase [Desulfomonilaceae bacterium]
MRLASIMGGASLFAGCSLLGENTPVPEYIAGAPAADPVETLAGVKTMYSVCGLCPGNCGIGCRVGQGILVKIGGNPYHPVSMNPPLSWDTPLEKALLRSAPVCAVGGSGIQTLYDPFRIARPLKRVGARGSGKWSALTWDQAIMEIVEGGDLFGEGTIPGLKKVKDSGSGLTLLTGRVDWGSDLFLNRFASAFPGAMRVSDGDNLSEERAIAAANRVFGPGSTPVAADYASARALISFGDAPLDSGIPLVSTARDIADARVDAHCLQWAVIDPRLSTSASKSDLWVPVIPGKDVELALGIMRAIADRYPAMRIPAEFERSATSRAVEEFAGACGISPAVVEKLANMLVQGGKKSAVIPGRGIFSGPNGTQAGATILALNAMVGSVPGSGGLFRRSDAFLARARKTISAGYEYRPHSHGAPVKAMILWETDIAYSDSTVASLLGSPSELPLVVAIDRGITETTALADYILPDTTFLERWDVCVPPASVSVPGVGLRSPVVGTVDPISGVYCPILPETRMMEDILIDIAKKLNLSGFGETSPSKPLNTAGDYYGMVFSAVLESMKEAGFPVSSPSDTSKILERGGLFSPQVSSSMTKPENNAEQLRHWPVKAPETAIDAVPKDDELLLITYALPFHRSPESGINSWLLEILPHNSLLMNSADAGRLKIRQGDAIVIESADGKTRLQGNAQVLPGIRPGVVALARGFGYRQSGAMRQVIGGTSVPPDKTRAAGVNASALTTAGSHTVVRVKKA